MSPRVAGAALALLAAVMLVAAVAGIPAGWWSGHPIRNGEAMHKKDIDISMLRAEGCDTGGDGHCEPLGSEMDGTFEVVRYVELGASGILVLACLLLAGVTITGSERRMPFGKLVIAMALLSAAVAGALIFLPKVKFANIELPVGSGLFVFFGGIACAFLGSILAMRPTPKLELQPPRQSFAPGLGAPPTAQPVDVLAMLQPEARPAQPDPMHSRPPPSPGGQLAGPAGPLAPPTFGSPQPFGSGPYAVPTAPVFAPPEHAPTVLPPTPFPAPPAPFSARPGGPPLATPPPPDARGRSGTGAPPLPDRTKSSSPMPAIPGDRSKSSSPMPAIPGDRSKSSSPMPAIPGDRFKASGTGPALPGVDRSKAASVAPPNADARTKAASMPPPNADARTKAASMPPPTAEARAKAASIPPPSADLRAKAASIPPPSADARFKAASVPPPAAARTKPASVPPPAAARTKPASVPPPASARTKPASVLPPGAAPSLGPIPSTVAGMMAPSRPSASDLTTPRPKGPSVPPPGGKKPTTVSAIVPPPPAGPLRSTMLPMRADTDPTDHLETMDRDAMTVARDGAPAFSVGRPQTDASIGDSTDASIALPDSGAAEENTDIAALPMEPMEPMEPRDSASEIQTSMQRKLTSSELVRTVARESQSEIETIAREKFSASDLAIGDSTNPAILADAQAEAGRRSAKEIKDLGEAPTAPARIGISTASQSLPPPKQAEVVASGPTPACPQCEAPMAWVEEHLRFYCKSCRMYF